MAVDEHGEPIRYDKLLVAVGARPQPALPRRDHLRRAGGRAGRRAGARGQRAARVRAAVRAPAGRCRSTSSRSWPPIELRNRGREPEITVVTPEPAPLWVFGAEASAAIAELLAERGIALRAGAPGRSPSHDGVLELDGGAARARRPRDRAAAPASGRRSPGLPHGRARVHPGRRARARRRRVEDVFAAGDATTFPLKQGGLATQQADAAAEAIAAELGVAVEPAPFRPVLRGLLLTGGAPLYLRSALSSAASRRPAQRAVPRAGVGGLAARAVVAAGQDRRPLPRAAAGHRAPAAAGDGAAAGLQPRPVDDDRDDARELALLLADEDAAMGDYAQACTRSTPRRR